MFQEAVSKEEAPRRDTGLPQNTIVRRAYAGDRAELLIYNAINAIWFPAQEAGAARQFCSQSAATITLVGFNPR